MWLTPQNLKEPSFAVEQAALIATFYGSRKKEEIEGIKKVRECLIDKLNLEPYGSRGEDWVNLSQPAEPILLRRFDPPAAQDTRVVQLALNCGGEVKGAWEAMRKKVEGILDDAHLRQIWGYSLIYQAVLQGNTLPDAENGNQNEALRELLAYGQRLDVAAGAKVPLLAQTDVEGGRLWLTAVPLEEDGVAAAIVYVALIPTEKQDDLIEKVLYGPNASLLMPDLIAHKGYQQRRQYYQGDMKQKYEQFANRLRDTASQILDMTEQSHQQHQLKQLQQDYKNFLSVLPIFRELRLSLARQEHNFQRWQTRMAGGDILEFHYEHIESSLRELELLVMKGEDTQRAVETTINLLQTTLEKQEEEREQTLQNWLAIIALAFAIPQLITPDVAKSLLILLAYPKAGAEYHTLLLLAVQIVVTLLFAILTWLGMTLVRRLR